MYKVTFERLGLTLDIRANSKAEASKIGLNYVRTKLGKGPTYSEIPRIAKGEGVEIGSKVAS